MEASENATAATATSNGSSSQSPWEAHQAAASANARPEIPVIGAFVGAFIFAKLLKAIGGDDD
jgi:hypothetical protein